MTDIALPAGYRLFAYDALGSTNDEAKRLARDGTPAGTLIWAREQTSGRGRRGRTWSSPPGNLYVSLIARPGCALAQAAQLGFAAALGLADALDVLTGSRLDLRCKWPNDLLADRRKIAGILLESEAGAGGAPDFVVIGTGVNLAVRPEDTEYPATSLSEQGFPDVAPAALLGAFVRHFDLWVGCWEADGFTPLRDAWLRRATGIGETIRVRLDRSTFTGRFVDLDADGALLLDAADGRRRVTAGEVFPVTVASPPGVLRDAGFAGSSA